MSLSNTHSFRNGKNKPRAVLVKEKFISDFERSYGYEKEVETEVTELPPYRIAAIPFAVIECKAPHISVEQGIEQMIRNQQDGYIPQLFKYIQIVMSTNKNSVKYATMGTGKKYWSIWKEEDLEFLESAKAKYVEDRVPTVQDENIISLLSVDRLKELSKYFVLYDANVKKICRYQQYFAIKEIIKTINTNDVEGNRQSGVIWHTQGSGKSLTMVMLAEYILLEMARLEPKVVIVTDRKELDKQIAKTFIHTSIIHTN